MNKVKDYERTLIMDLNDPKWDFVDKSNIKEIVNQEIKRCDSVGLLYGEADADPLDSSLSKVSHVLMKIEFEDNKIYAMFKFLNTHWGIQTTKLIDEGTEYDFIIRAMGSSKNSENILIYGDSFIEVKDKKEYELLSGEKITLKKIFTWDVGKINNKE